MARHADSAVAHGEHNVSAHVVAKREDGSVVEFDTVVRIDAAAEVEYFRNGGILQMVLRQLPR